MSQDNDDKQLDDLPRLDPSSIDLEAIDLDGDERRRAQRTPFEIVVRFLKGDIQTSIFAIDLSRNGIRIQPPQIQLDIGDTIELHFTIPNERHIIKVLAECATLNPDRSIGLYFLDIDEAQAEAIDNFALLNGWLL